MKSATEQNQPHAPTAVVIVIRQDRSWLRRQKILVLECCRLAVESLRRPPHNAAIGPQRSTMVHAFEQSWKKGVFFYPFIGAVFGAVFVVTFHLTGKSSAIFLEVLDLLNIWPSTSPAQVTRDYGPEVALRFGPPMAAILIASVAGSVISSWVGQMSGGRYLDGFKLLGVDPRREILAPVWWALFAAAALHVAAFITAIVGVFVTYLALVDQDALGSIRIFFSKFAESDPLISIGKSVFYAMLVATISVAVAAAPARNRTEATGAINKAIVWCCSAVMVIEFVVVGVLAMVRVDNTPPLEDRIQQAFIASVDSVIDNIIGEEKHVIDAKVSYSDINFSDNGIFPTVSGTAHISSDPTPDGVDLLDTVVKITWHGRIHVIATGYREDPIRVDLITLHGSGIESISPGWFDKMLVSFMERDALYGIETSAEEKINEVISVYVQEMRPKW